MGIYFESCQLEKLSESKNIHGCAVDGDCFNISFGVHAESQDLQIFLTDGTSMCPLCIHCPGPVFTKPLK